MTTITWSQIEAECGDYRAGFVATFRKYEGRDTDERDGSNRIVRVTEASFERHMGLGRGQLGRWIKAADQEVGQAPTRSHAGAARRFADKLPPEEKAKLAAELVQDPEVVDELARDRESRQTIRQAATDATLSKLPDPDYRRERSSGSGVAGALGSMADELEVQGLVGAARSKIREAIDIARRASFDADAQEITLDGINKLRAYCDHLESAVTSADVDLDRALADLLDGEAS